MEEFRKFQYEYLRRKGREIPCVGELASQRSYVSSNGFKIPPRAFETVSIKVNNRKNGESVWVIPGTELVGLLPPEQLAQVIEGYIYLNMRNWSYVSQEIKAETIVCIVKSEVELYNVVCHRKEQSRVSILVPPGCKLLNRVSVTLKVTTRTKNGRRIYC